MTEQTINMCRYKQINLSIDTDIYNIQIQIDKVNVEKYQLLHLGSGYTSNHCSGLSTFLDV